MADFHNYTRMVGPRVTKFGTITHVGQERVSITPRLKQWYFRALELESLTIITAISSLELELELKVFS